MARANSEDPRQDGPSTMPTDAAGWWESERATFIRERVARATTTGSWLLDVGCGRGTMFDGRALADRTVVKVDSHIWEEWTGGHGLYVCATADALPFRDGSFDLVGSFDVLEHLNHPERAVAEQERVVRDDGTVVAAVPADQRLWSGHDEAVGHHRRYDPGTMHHLLAKVDLAPLATTHFFSYLWLPAYITRNKAARRTEPGNEYGLSSMIIQAVISACSKIERFAARRLELPFGTSLWVESHRATPVVPAPVAEES